MFNSDLDSEFQIFRSSIPQRKVTILIIYFVYKLQIKKAYIVNLAIFKKPETNSRDRQPIKEFIVFLRVLRVCRNEGFRVYEGFESS